MRNSYLRAALFGLVAAGLGAAAAAAQERPVRIGILNDRSGPYADFQGVGSVIAAQMAVEDFGGRVGGSTVEIVAADHQNKTDVGATIAQTWFDRDGVDMIADVPNSAIALAVSAIAREKNKVLIGSGAGSSELTGKQCSPNTVHWTYDTYALGHALGRAVLQRGGDRWFFITADYAFGLDLEAQARDQVLKDGGQVLGSARHPINNADFSSYLLAAQSSGAKVLGLANAGADETNAIKQAVEFGLDKSMSMVGLVFDLNNVTALGLQTAKGLLTVNAWYWDTNDASRRFAERFAARHPQSNFPNQHQAGVYGAVLHYLKGVQAAGGATDGRAVVEAMKTTPTDDPLFGKGSIRVDGRKIHPMYLLQVKEPGASKREWDYFDVVATVPGEEAFRPLAAGGCSLVR